MLEFDSISVSSYEADSLAPQLTEKSAAGWQVVSIVSAGSSVTAYLSRAAEAGAGSDAPAAVESFGGEETGPIEDVAIEPATTIDEPVVSTPAADIPVIDGLSADTPQVSDVPVAPAERFSPGAVDVPAIDEPPVETPEPSSSWQPDTPSTPSLADDVAALASQIEEEHAAPTDEPAGWGATTTAEPAAEAASTPSSEPTPSYEPMLPGSTPADQHVAEPVVEAAPEPAQQAATAASTAAASAAAAPAGWYADPSTRFELRYWDGAQWTEHVSRAGQQYTDPPVA